MKYIFDFDDVLFNNTTQFKKWMYGILSNSGIIEERAREYYKEVREYEFSLKKFIAELLVRHGQDINQTDSIYGQIMSKCKNFINDDLIKMVRKIGKENCYLISNGEGEFQHDKIKNSGLAPLFSEIIIVPKSKNEVIYNLCSKFADEKVFFIEDKIKFIEDIDKTQCPNLEVIHYTGQPVEFI